VVYTVIVAATVFCASRVMRARRLMAVTIWLAAVSALTATLLYTLGAHEVAVMELSVGAGLVTVLFVFAFSIVGEETFDKTTIIPRALAWLVVILLVLLLGWMALPLAPALTGAQAAGAQESFGSVLWEQRGLDVLIQVALIFAGVIGLIGLLSEKRAAVMAPVAAPTQTAPVSEAPAPFQPGLDRQAPEEVHA
jgi:uncharacterized MnhB-related membrane protein